MITASNKHPTAGMPDVDEVPFLTMPAERDIFEGMTADEKAFVQGKVAALTDKELVGQLFHHFVTAMEESGYPMGGWITHPVDRGGLAEFVLANTKFDTNPLYANVPYPYLQADHLRGLFEKETAKYPQSRFAASSFDPNIVNKQWSVTSRLLSSLGGNAIFGPQADYGGYLAEGRAEERYGEDPVVISKMMIAAGTGGQENNLVAATVKHYPEGLLNKENFNTGPNFLREQIIPGFKSFIPDSKIVMASYLPMNGVYAPESAYLMTTVLRNYLQFNGMLMTDAGPHNGMTEYGTGFDIKGVVRRQIMAGVNQFLIQAGSMPDAALELLEEPEVRSKIVESVTRTFAIKYKLKLFRDQPGGLNFTEMAENADSIEEAILADSELEASTKDAAQKSVVLLKNDGLLPLSKTTQIGITGPTANTKEVHIGSWAWGVETDFLAIGDTYPATNPVQSMVSSIEAKAYPSVDLTQPYTADEMVQLSDSNLYLGASKYSTLQIPKFVYSPADIAAARVGAAEVDTVVVCIGTQVPTTHQQADLSVIYGSKPKGVYVELLEPYSGFEIPRNEQKLIEGLLDDGKNVILVMLGKSMLVVPDHILSRVGAFVLGGQAGTYGADAIVDILYGDVNPSAKLPVTYPKSTSAYYLPYNSLGQPQMFPDFPFPELDPAPGPPVLGPWPVSGQVLPSNDYDAAFPFGHGLSYTTFSKSGINASYSGTSVTVTYTITNTGGRSGRDIAFLYCHNYQTHALNLRMAKYALVDFTTVDLAPGESKTVEFVVPLSKMAIVVGDHHEMLFKQKWVPPGPYTFLVNHHEPLVEDYLAKNVQWATIAERAGGDVSLESVIADTQTDDKVMGAEIVLNDGFYVDEF